MTHTTNELGPLAFLEGTWDGVGGNDISPDEDRSTMETGYRETLTFRATGEVTNHEQSLFGLAYENTVWPDGETEPFHEESGYWLWDAERSLVMRAFSVPRGYTAFAGGETRADSRDFALTAELGNETFGICQNPFLASEFRTVRFECRIIFHSDDCFSYEQDTHLKMAGRDDIFHHRNSIRMSRRG